jgi:hypothetical protein
MKLHPAVVVLGLLGAALGFHSSFPGLLGIDGFFHVAQAQRMNELGFVPEQTWMSYGVAAHSWVDHHWGFHFLLMPFARFGLAGAKVGTALFAGGSVAASYLFLRSFKVPGAALWALVPVALSWSFLFRLMTVRAMCVSTGLLVLVLYLALRGPAWALFVTAAVWATGYHLAVLAAPVALGAWLVPKMLKREGPTFWTALAGPLGFVAGLAVHPHSPQTFDFFLEHAAIGAADPSGVEWQPPILSEFWMHGGVILVIVVVLGGLAVRRRPQLSVETVLLLVGAAAGTMLTLRSMRFVDFGAPLLALAGGLLWRDLGIELRTRTSQAAAVAILLCLMATAHTARSVRHPAFDRTFAAAAWLADNVPPGARVHNMQWGWWPEWVFAAPDYAYTVGFDPTLLAGPDAGKLEHYRNIQSGYYENAGAAIRQEFAADWAVVGLPDAAAELFRADPTLELAFESPGALVFRVR